MSIFASDNSDDESWLQEHKKHFQNSKTNFTESTASWQSQEPREKTNLRPSPPQLSGAKKECQHCRREAPMESFRAEKCLACQVTDFLDPAS